MEDEPEGWTPEDVISWLACAGLVLLCVLIFLVCSKYLYLFFK